MNTTGGSARPARSVIACADVDRAAGTQRRAGRRRRRRAVPRGGGRLAGTTRPREVDQDRLHGVAGVGERRRRWRCRKRSRRRAPPTGHPAGRRRVGRRRPRSSPARVPVIAPPRARATASRSNRRGTRSRRRASTPWRSAMTRRGRDRPDGGRRRPCPFWSLTMKLACFSRHRRSADPRALQSGLVDEPPGRVVRRVAEHAARRGQAERLVGLAPVPDVVEARLDRVRIRRRQPERRLDDQLGGRVRRRCLSRVSR